MDSPGILLEQRSHASCPVGSLPVSIPLVLYFKDAMSHWVHYKCP
jgi:hypothetical protein